MLVLVEGRACPRRPPRFPLFLTPFKITRTGIYFSKHVTFPPEFDCRRGPAVVSSPHLSGALAK